MSLKLVDPKNVQVTVGGRAVQPFEGEIQTATYSVHPMGMVLKQGSAIDHMRDVAGADIQERADGLFEVRYVAVFGKTLEQVQAALGAV